MAPNNVVTAGDIAHLRECSVALCKASLTLTGLSQGIRFQIDEVRRLARQAQARLTATRRESVIDRKLRDGRLPRASAPVIIGGPGGASATCDGCDAPLVPAQLVMAVPLGDTGFVHLHADCFMVWNAMWQRARQRRIA